MASPRTDYPSYSAAHKRVRAARGKASLQLCVDCGGAADEWSYDDGDENALTETRGHRELRYSANVDHYDPRCQSCHLRFDRPVIAREDRP